jgi:DNA-3-methyladenine glycosylase I
MNTTHIAPTTEPPTFRCFGDGNADYEAYHDIEWGHPVHGDANLFERIALEGFQSGLSWLTVLRKLEAFREVFSGFDPSAVSKMTEHDVDQLLQDARIIRNRMKIEATISNARAILSLHGSGTSLDELFWSFKPEAHRRPRTFGEMQSTSVESIAMAKALKKLGFRFFGPTTAHAAMQATGVINDHLVICQAGDLIG